jgi:hypothetical protein
MLQEDVPKVDYERIQANGALTMGTVTDITLKYNETINNQHPTIISYQYKADGETFESKFKTLFPDSVSGLQVGDTVSVKYLNGESIIASLQPFSFPFDILFIIPGVFFLMGLPCVLIIVYQTRNEIHLMKFGVIKEAEVISMSHNPGLPLSKMGQGLQIHYQYKTDHHKTHIAHSFTSDMLLLNTLKQGDKIKIFVSPDDSSKSILISRLEAIRNNWNIA